MKKGVVSVIFRDDEKVVDLIELFMLIKKKTYENITFLIFVEILELCAAFYLLFGWPMVNFNFTAIIEGTASPHPPDVNHYVLISLSFLSPEIISLFPLKILLQN